MSLLSEAMTPCVFIDKIHTEPDGYGGAKTEWVAGAEFKAAIVLDNSMQARIGEKQGVTSLYTVTVSKSLSIGYHEVFKRLSDGKIFRVTSPGEDNKTPNTAGLNMQNFSAEEWSLPNG